MAVEEAPEYKRINEITSKMADAIQDVISQHTTTALAYVEDRNINKAEKELQAIVSLDPNNESVDTIRNKLEEAKDVINEIGPKPMNSEWDAAVRPVVKYLENNLKDPDSCEYIEWSPVTLQEVQGEKYWAVRVKYRATKLLKPH